MEFFEARDIVKRYSNHLALDHVCISVSQASIFGLLGPNGAGKTTLIRIINRIIAPDEGELFFNGKPLNTGHINLIGYLPEERGLYKKMKVGEQSIYLARLKGLSRADALRRLKYWFEKFEVDTWWDKRIEELSKGMAQKIQFIITILHEPRLLIFDEPFSGFDPINTNILKQEILKLKEKGCTIIFSTHNMGSVEELCDHITLINESKCILDGPIDSIRKTYSSNCYEIVFSGYFNKHEATLTSLYEILDYKEENGLSKIKVRLLNEITTNDMLGIMTKFGNIVAFNEIIPGMNEIFIRVVEETSNGHKVSNGNHLLVK
ncbi:MAG: ATP-binding cassette domain-containing protein [Bacteroidetes bacterium]|nr:ATP-binding cassette domain-containing protein [Bacteroidota bacterium]